MDTVIDTHPTTGISIFVDGIATPTPTGYIAKQNTVIGIYYHYRNTNKVYYIMRICGEQAGTLPGVKGSYKVLARAINHKAKRIEKLFTLLVNSGEDVSSIDDSVWIRLGSTLLNKNYSDDELLFIYGTYNRRYNYLSAVIK